MQARGQAQQTINDGNTLHNPDRYAPMLTGCLYQGNAVSCKAGMFLRKTNCFICNKQVDNQIPPDNLLLNIVPKKGYL